MIFKKVAAKVSPSLRRIHTTSALKHDHHISTRGVFGSNLPFPVDSKPKLVALFCIFFGSGLALPFLSLRYKIVKANNN